MKPGLMNLSFHLLESGHMAAELQEEQRKTLILMFWSNMKGWHEKMTYSMSCMKTHAGSTES